MPPEGFLNLADRASIIRWAAAQPVVQRVWVFGSRARGDPREGSDIDLAVETEGHDLIEAQLAYSDLPVAFKRLQGIDLSSTGDVHWYHPDADLPNVGPGVRRDGVLVYDRVNSTREARMTIELVEGPWKAASIEALHFRVARDGVQFLCRITDLALFDDYRESYEGNTMETLFEKHLDDVLRRTSILLPDEPSAEEGQPEIVIKRGMAI